MDKFKILKAKTVYKSSKVQVDTETVQLPDGTTADWDLMVYPDFYIAITVKDQKVMLTKEWRLGPHDYLTQFTKARCPHPTEEENLKEIARELNEEMGIVGGKYQKLVSFSQGERLSGFTTVYLLTEFEIGKTNRDIGEIQDIIELPIKGLYEELKNNHVCMAETLLIAKILETEFA